MDKQTPVKQRRLPLSGEEWQRGSQRERGQTEVKPLAKESGTKSIGGNWEVGEQEGSSNDMVLLATDVTWEHPAAQLVSA